MKRIMVLLAFLGVVLIPGTAFAGTHGGVSALVSPDGTAVFLTTQGPAAQDIQVTVAVYSGKWKGQTQPEQLFSFKNGVIKQGDTKVTLSTPIPNCGPYQVDAILGWEVPQTITFPEGTGPTGLKGQAYPNLSHPCSSPSPTPTPTPTSPSPTPTTTMTVPPTAPHPTPDGTPPTQPPLPKTGTADVMGLGALSLLLVLAGAGLITWAMRHREERLRSH